MENIVMTPFEALKASGEDKMVEFYIDNFAFDKSNFPLGRTASIEKILRPWSRAKTPLFNYFGQKLILERDVSFALDANGLARKMSNAISFEYSRSKSKAGEFLDAYNIFCSEMYSKAYDHPHLICKDMWPGQFYSILKGLIRPFALAKNIYEDETFYVYVPGEATKFQKFTSGTKVMKILGRLAAMFNIPYFEEFRLFHSRVVNTGKLEGTFCLSIHPMDYMTMSDNNDNWRSCMNWRDNGCYRQGTVEMMNSNYVVVAYLKNKNHNMELNDNFTWNSKMWRNLIIVNPDATICSVKAYPYAHKEMTQYAVNWLKELIENHFGDKMFTDIVHVHPYEDTFIPGEKMNGNGEEDWTVHFSPSTCYMYNDYDNSETNSYGCFSVRYILDHANSVNHTYFELEYSGCSECMICGATDIEVPNEEYLVGYCCGAGCPGCDNFMAHDEFMYEVDGEYICSRCYANSDHVSEDFLGDIHLTSNLTRYALTIPNVSAASDENVFWYVTSSSAKTFSRYIYCEDDITNRYPNVKFLRIHYTSFIDFTTLDEESAMGLFGEHLEVLKTIFMTNLANCLMSHSRTFGLKSNYKMFAEDIAKNFFEAESYEALMKEYHIDFSKYPADIDQTTKTYYFTEFLDYVPATVEAESGNIIEDSAIYF